MFTLTEEEKKLLKDLAKKTLFEAVIHNRRFSLDPSNIPTKLLNHLGAFVTLKKNGKLRGCIGQFEPDIPLYEVIIEMTISASRYDTRFEPVKPEELDTITIEISVLTPRVRVNSIDDVIIPKHGIYITYNGKSGTYLPQVATDMNWSKEEFVWSCCVEKAGIDPQHCKDAELWVYEAIVF
jgi:AmmeMemoRadiSam system protein A